MRRPSLLDVHGKLSELVCAVQMTFPELSLDVRAQWREGTYLSVEIETYERNKQLVVDRLSHGVLVGNYDFRFTLSYPTMPAEPLDRVWVTAYPNLHWPPRKGPPETVEFPRAQVEQALALIDDMSRHVGKMALQDYAAFNEVPTNLRRALG